ncbi:hypothetical protein LPJ73_001844 [Coemansia sp. RSA 2703]|nr:hypothetical protein LPJ73_001844 [Coemansia sp. RSA 2703]KAJ2371237.1 hypothetical protein IW150_004683 [Coemansia sp. RSA 2607]KAJ2395449.1 hypothetical protein GGI05_001581 [Coemansia sp. RSA 2603]
MSGQYTDVIRINEARFIADAAAYKRVFDEYSALHSAGNRLPYRVEFFGDFAPSHYDGNSDAPYSAIIEKCKQHLMHSSLFRVHMVNNASGFLKDMFWINGKTGVIFYRGAEMVTHMSGDMISYAEFRAKLATLDTAAAEHSPKKQDDNRKRALEQQSSSSGCCTIM